MKKIFSLSIFCFITIISFSQMTVYPEGLKTGDKAPEFTAKDNQGNDFDMNKQLEKGEVVLIFYRGQWCPYCNKELSEMNDSLSLITATGASIIAVTPELMENVAKTVAKTKASFPIISDSALSIMKLYKVNYAVDDTTRAKYKNYGIDFMLANGSNGANLPVPATYVIDKNGNIKYVFFNPDYRYRSSVKDILDNL